MVDLDENQHMIAPPGGVRVTETGAGVFGSRESCKMGVNVVVNEVC